METEKFELVGKLAARSKTVFALVEAALGVFEPVGESFPQSTVDNSKLVALWQRPAAQEIFEELEFKFDPIILYDE